MDGPKVLPVYIDTIMSHLVPNPVLPGDHIAPQRAKSIASHATRFEHTWYDGQNWRIQETHGSTSTDIFFSSDWQVLEERIGANVDAQNTWSPVYVNALIKRDQSSAHNGTLDQHLWA
ncbi:MAG: hypothetical protein ACRD1G_16455, partial [Acidimicrobiales bacterium]